MKTKPPIQKEPPYVPAMIEELRVYIKERWEK